VSEEAGAKMSLMISANCRKLCPPRL
jgi:hypothetical protein